MMNNLCVISDPIGCEFKESVNGKYCIHNDKFYKLGDKAKDPLASEAIFVYILTQYIKMYNNKKQPDSLGPFKFTPFFEKFVNQYMNTDSEMIVLEAIPYHSCFDLFNKTSITSQFQIEDRVTQFFIRNFSRYFFHASLLGLSHSDLHFGNFGIYTNSAIERWRFILIDWGRGNMDLQRIVNTYATHDEMSKTLCNLNHTQIQLSEYSINDVTYGWLCDLASLAYQFAKLKFIQQTMRPTGNKQPSVYPEFFKIQMHDSDNDELLSYHIGPTTTIVETLQMHMNRLASIKNNEKEFQEYLVRNFYSIGLSWLALYVRTCHYMFGEELVDLSNDSITDVSDQNLTILLIFENGVLNGMIYNEIFNVLHSAIEGGQASYQNALQEKINQQKQATPVVTSANIAHKRQHSKSSTITNVNCLTEKGCSKRNKRDDSELSSFKIALAYGEYLRGVMGGGANPISGANFKQRKGPRKYIKVNNAHLFLQEIHGQYRYLDKTKNKVLYKPKMSKQEFVRTVQTSKEDELQKLRLKTLENFGKPTKKCMESLKKRLHEFRVNNIHKSNK